MADTEFFQELFSTIEGVSLRRMFGGVGVFRDGLMFGLIDGENTLYLKADAGNRPAYEAESCEPFAYVAKGERQVSMSYWRIPERLLDDPDEFRLWALTACAAAARSKAVTIRKKPKSKS